MSKSRHTVSLTLATTAVLAMAVIAQSVIAQQGHDEHDPFQGVTIEALSSTVPSQLPGYTLVLLRITLGPGAEIPGHGHPGAVALIVESGTFATEFTRGSGQVTRLAVGNGEPQQEQVSTGAETVLQPGESLAYDGQASEHTMRNAGDTPVVLLISALLAADKEGFLFDEAQ